MRKFQIKPYRKMLDILNVIDEEDYDNEKESLHNIFSLIKTKMKKLIPSDTGHSHGGYLINTPVL